MGSSQQFSLRWNNYLSHITGAFDNLRSDGDLVDVTLSCEGKRIRAHKMLLSACSTYFRDLFKENPCQHPVIIFRDVKFEDLVALVDFMYQGEVNVVQEQLTSFLTTAELLAVQGLSEGGGKKSNTDNKETELPDSPVLASEPQAQVSNNSQVLSSSTASGVGSPISFFPVDQRSDSPPSAKRRKWGNTSSSSGVGSKSSAASVSIKKDSDTESGSERRRGSLAQPVRNSSPDPVEIIPVVPNLKLEMPDYMDQEQDASSCSYSDSNQGGAGNGGGQSSNRDTIPSMTQVLPHSGASTSADGMQEPPDLYSANSRDASLPPSAEGVSASDLSQILAKPGPSGESQAQDSLQGVHRGSNPPVVGAASSPFCCNRCGRLFRHKKSCQLHMAMHLGETTCHICSQVLSRIGNMRRHLRHIHGITQYTDLWVSSGILTFQLDQVPLTWIENQENTKLLHVCDICGKGFLHRNSLYHHTPIHAGATRCPICHLVFSRKGNCRRHQLLVHGVVE